MKRKLIQTFVSVVAGVSVLAMASGGFAQSERKGFRKTVVIDILEGFISASEVAIQTGTTVVWHNATNRFVDVNFSTGQEVRDSCVAPIGFELERGVYQAANITPGGVASLCFVKPGAYHFSAIPQGTLTFGWRSSPGTIIVRRD
ncbi:MAG: hypothetical protein ACE5IM_13920 [Nitrospinota bacterium]